MNNIPNNIEHRYSRQSYAIGTDAQTKLSESNILVIGYNSLSQEIIRNLALIGVKSIDIFVKKLEFENYQKTGLYYKTDSENILLEQLSKLNPLVKISIQNILNEDGELNYNQFKKYHGVITTNCTINDGIAINRITHELSIPFIMTGTYGLFGYVFNDFGDNFGVVDVDGEPCENLILESVESRFLKFKDPHNLSDGKTFTVISTDNNKSVWTVHRKKTPYIIELTEEPPQDKNTYSKVFRNKVSKTINFGCLAANIENIRYTISDWSVPINRTNFLHKLHLGLNRYLNEYGEIPHAWNNTDWKAFEKYFEFENEEEKMIAKKICFTMRGDLMPMSSIIGGIVSHEMLKAITHKFNPIEQWFYTDYTDLILDEEINKFTDDFASKYKTDSKYEGIVNIFGIDFVNKLQSMVPFVVGSGAIGCELIKNLGMMGVNKIYLTDPDYIEKSNLSRQFLFGDADIRQSKAEIAGKKINQMNSDSNIIVFKEKMCLETENIFNAEFHSKIDVYLNALDNVNARMYMDSCAIKYSKPLIDSGTLGSKGNIQVILPHLTETYSSTKDPEEKSGIPICTIKSFPYKPEHTIQWARELFETEFNQIPSFLNKYKNKEELKKINDADLKNLFKLLFKYNDFELSSRGFFNILMKIFCENYFTNIRDIINKHVDIVHDKKMPDMLNFNNLSLDDINSYIRNGFIILNQMFKTNFVPLDEQMNTLDIKCFEQIEFKYKSDVGQTDELDSDYVLKILNPIIEIMPDAVSIEFEKDDDELRHVDWITLCANIRNTQYNIPHTNVYETRKIAGGIIPAMITTTSLISGFQILEYIKILKLYSKDKYLKWEKQKPHDDIDKYKNRFVNLNTNYCDGVNPNFIKRFKLDEEKYLSAWTNLYVNSTNVDIMIKQIESDTGKKVDFMTWGDQTLFDGDDILIDEIEVEIDSYSESQNLNLFVMLEDIEMGIPVYLIL